jgi:hypothetical protein
MVHFHKGTLVEAKERTSVSTPPTGRGAATGRQCASSGSSARCRDLSLRRPDAGAAALVEAGREADSCPVTLFGVAEDADTLKRYRDLGVARVTAALPAAKKDVILPILDRWAPLIREIG